MDSWNPQPSNPFKHLTGLTSAPIACRTLPLLLMGFSTACDDDHFFY
jgi:hypothetical protein